MCSLEIYSMAKQTICRVVKFCSNLQRSEMGDKEMDGGVTTGTCMNSLFTHILYSKPLRITQCGYMSLAQDIEFVVIKLCNHLLGCGMQKMTLTPLDTWSCPTLGLACALILRPISPELVLFPDFSDSDIPRYFYFTSVLSYYFKLGDTCKHFILRLCRRFDFFSLFKGKR